MLDGDPVPLPKKGWSPLPIFGPCPLWPNGWMMKTPLCMEVDLGPGHIVLDRDRASPRKGHSSPPLSAHVYCGHGRPSQLRLSSYSVFSLDYFLLVSFCFVLLGLVHSVLCQEIGWEERLWKVWNDLLYRFVGLPETLTQSNNQAVMWEFLR